MRAPLAACSAALSGSLVLAMVGAAVGVDAPALPLAAPTVIAALGAPNAVPTTPVVVPIRPRFAAVTAAATTVAPGSR